jgi:acyl-CoA dehydrogenase
MNFDFSDDQKELAEQTRKALERRCPLEEVRRVADTNEPFSHDAWSALSSLGALGAAVPEEYGGVGLGLLELCIVAEQIGRSLAPVPFLSTVGLVGTALQRFGSDAQRARWLPPLVEGKLIGCFADSEGAGEVAPSRVWARFENGALIGRKCAVIDGIAAQVAVVLARAQPSEAGSDYCLCLVPLDQARVSRRPISAIDPAISVAEITFDSATAELLPEGTGWPRYEGLLDTAAVLLSFEALGAADAALEQALSYALQRRAFGRVIASYQAIKHKLAHIYVKTQLARANAYYAAWAGHSGDASLGSAAACAWLSATEAFSVAAQESNQVHGGISFTWEANCHLFYKRSKVLATRLGNRFSWKDRLVDRIVDSSDSAPPLTV